MKQLTLLFLAGAAALSFSACSNPAKYEDPNGTNTIVSLDKVSIQDFAKAADALTQSFLKSGAYARMSAAGKQPVMAISAIRNDTATPFDTDLLMQKLYATLTNTGAVQISSTVGTNSDRLTKDLGAAGDFSNGTDPSARGVPEYTLTAKILEDRANAGSVRQTSYIFNMTINDTRTGNVVWAEQKIVTKQGEKNSVGW